MRLATYQYNGATCAGRIDGAMVVPLPFADVRAAIEASGLAAMPSGPGIPVDQVTLLPVVPRPDKVLCIGINYDEHRRETGRATTEQPVVFTRFANTLVAHNGALIRPRVSTELDYEGELAVVIGKRIRHASVDDALKAVAGYACFNDASVRDWQRHTSQFTPGKNFVATGGLGPYLVTAEEIPDPQKLQLTTRLNGAVVQHASTSDMIFDVAHLIAYITTFTELVPGDIIATGTPGGVGSKRTPPLFMRDGDVVEVEISSVGTLRNPVVDETT